MIDKADLTLSTVSVSKTYDGTLSALGRATVVGGVLFPVDSLTGGTFAFTDKNVGAASKTVTASAVTVGDGVNNANYNVSYVPNTTSTINVRPVSTWTAAGSGLWSVAGNWDALPDGLNVLAVAIPAGASVTYDTAAGATSLQSLTSAGALTLAAGQLSVAGKLTTPQYSQTGGALAGAGSLAVNGSFSQTGGTIVLGGPVSITQSAGNLAVGSINAGAITLSAPSGGITQTAPLVTTGLLTTGSLSSTVLNDPGNHIASFNASTTGVGDIQLTTVGVLDVQSMNVASGNFTLVDSGGTFTSGPVVATNGSVSMTTNSPLTIGPAGVSASGDITLTATNLTSAGNMTLNGNLVSSAGNIVLAAASSLVQNDTASAALTVTASAGSNGGSASMSYSLTATSVGSAVTYSLNGVPVIAPGYVPKISLLPTPVATFLLLFEQALGTPLLVSATTTDPTTTDPTDKTKTKDGLPAATVVEICLR